MRDNHRVFTSEACSPSVSMTNQRQLPECRNAVSDRVDVKSAERLSKAVGNVVIESE